jgi:hypothetical protein
MSLIIERHNVVPEISIEITMSSSFLVTGIQDIP